MAKNPNNIVYKGKHMTITKSADGKENFTWDWKKLEKEVALAIKNYEKAKR
jgi:hypothetical protein